MALALDWPGPVGNFPRVTSWRQEDVLADAVGLFPQLQVVAEHAGEEVAADAGAEELHEDVGPEIHALLLVHGALDQQERAPE